MVNDALVAISIAMAIVGAYELMGALGELLVIGVTAGPVTSKARLEEAAARLFF